MNPPFPIVGLEVSRASGSCEVLGRSVCASFCASLLKMAPVLEKKLLGAVGTGDTMENSNEDDEGQNLWYARTLRLP